MSPRLPPALAILLLVLGCTGPETRRARFIERGEALAAQHDYAKARVEFRNALQINAKDSKTLMRAGEMSEQLESFNDAVMFYQAAIKTDSANNRARANLGRLMVAGGLAEETRKLIDAAPAGTADADLLAVRGAALQLLGDSAGALSEGEKANHLAPGNENAASLLASLYTKVNRNADALRVVGQALKLTPNSIELRDIMAQLEFNAGNLAGAEEQLRKVIQIEPDVPGHRNRLAQFYLVNNQVDAAEKTLREAVSAKPDEIPAKLALANLIAAHRSFADGEKELKNLIASNGDSLPLQLALGAFYATHDHAEQAIAAYRAVIEKNDTGPSGLTARDRIAAIHVLGNRVGEAEKLIDEVLKSNPRDNDALIMRAELALSRGDAAQAITDLRAVLRDNPNETAVMRTLAHAYLANQDKPLAEETLRQAIRANPREIATRLELAKFLIDTGRADEAQAVVDQLSGERSGGVQGLEAAFRVQLARNDLSGARNSARAIRAVDPKRPLGYFLAGLIDENDRKYDEALANYEKALALPDSGIEPLAAAVRVDLLQKHPEKALTRIDTAIGNSPQNAVLVNLKGEVLTQADRSDEAIAAFEQALRLAPKWWVPYLGIAAANLIAKHDSAAFAAFKRGVDATRAPPLLLQFAATYEQLGRPADAIALYEDWLEREPTADVAANNLAMLLITYQSQDKAARDRALQLTQHFANLANASLVDTYGWVRYVRGEYEAAVAPLERAVSLNPGSPLLHYHLGMAQFRAGKTESARKQLNAAVVTGAEYDGLDEARKTLVLLGPTT